MSCPVSCIADDVCILECITNDLCETDPDCVLTSSADFEDAMQKMTLSMTVFLGVMALFFALLICCCCMCCCAACSNDEKKKENNNWNWKCSGKKDDECEWKEGNFFWDLKAFIQDKIDDHKASKAANADKVVAKELSV